jgi:hypothetical protein
MPDRRSARHLAAAALPVGLGHHYDLDHSHSARTNLALSCADCCHCFVLKYRVHQRKKTTENGIQFSRKSVQIGRTSQKHESPEKATEVSGVKEIGTLAAVNN